MIAAEYERRCETPSDIVDHLPRLFAEADKPGVRVIELGVRTGNSTVAFLHAAERNDGHVWSVDISPPKVPFKDHERWTFIHGSDMDAAVSSQLPVGVDVLFIDTSHHYEHTVAELDTYAAFVKPGGVILLHDTEVERPHLAPPNPAYPVKVAVLGFVERTGWPVEFVEECYGLGVIRVPGKVVEHDG